MQEKNIVTHSFSHGPPGTVPKIVQDHSLYNWLIPVKIYIRVHFKANKNIFWNPWKENFFHVSCLQETHTYSFPKDKKSWGFEKSLIMWEKAGLQRSATRRSYLSTAGYHNNITISAKWKIVIYFQINFMITIILPSQQSGKL